MAAVFFYQSLNSNSSTTHDLAASTGQALQRKTHDNMSSQYSENNSGVLRHPVNTNLDADIAIQGPAELIPVAQQGAAQGKSETDQSTMLTMIESKARQVHQLSHRHFGQQCNVMALGELDASHPDMSAISLSTGRAASIAKKPKACNCFTVFGAGIEAEGNGWCAVKYANIVVIFVHVPNKIARDKDKLSIFYQTIRSKALQTCGPVDVIIGDTNQPSQKFSPAAITLGMGKAFVDAHSEELIPVDTYSEGTNNIHKGTNSANNKKFDVAIYNTESVKNISVEYCSQLSFSSERSSQSTAYTDHMGLLVKIEKK